MKQGAIVTAIVVIGIAALAGWWTPGAPAAAGRNADAAAAVSVIVQGRDLETAAAAVRSAGGEVTHELGIIDAVGAELEPAQLARLRAMGGALRVSANRGVEVAGGTPYGHFPAVVGADRLHDEAITGYGVTIAFVDTGNWSQNGIIRNTAMKHRILAQCDAILDQALDIPSVTTDDNGHGAHVTSIAVSSALVRPENKYNGIAPDAEFVMVKAFDADGNATHADVIRGLEWIVDNMGFYGIRVLNLSFAAEPRSYYWDDPINQAVMKAWQAGLVVVASAGNTGPAPMTITVPGNVPYVVTVGAMTDNYTPGDPSDDRIAKFSAAGPTAEAFVKPEVVAPGGHMLALMSVDTTIAQEHPELQESGSYFTMSGTSQSTAVVTGVAALMLEADPSLSNDDVKCRLMYSAKVAVNPDDSRAYSVFQQGAGMVDAYDAVHSTMTDCANQGLDIHADVAGTTHFHGLAEQDANGDYYMTNHAGDADLYWDGSYALGGAYPFVGVRPRLGGRRLSPSLDRRPDRDHEHQRLGRGTAAAVAGRPEPALSLLRPAALRGGPHHVRAEAELPDRPSGRGIA